MRLGIVRATGNFLAYNTNHLTGGEWGRVQRSDEDNAAQPACVVAGEAVYDSGEGSGECYYCQQWFWVEDGVIVDEWWDCTPIDESYCESEA
jgi:hypothetical protein